MNFFFVMMIYFLWVFKYLYFNYMLVHVLLFLFFIMTLLYDIYVFSSVYNSTYFFLLRVYFLYFLVMFWGLAYMYLFLPYMCALNYLIFYFLPLFFFDFFKIENLTKMLWMFY